MKYISVLVISILTSNWAISQSHAIEDNNQEHSKQKEPGLEVVFSGLFIHSPEHSETNFANELHITYWTTHRWAFGAGYTLIYEGHGHVGHELAALISHKRWNFLTINMGPSFTIPNSDSDFELSAYTEAEFAMTLGPIHFGPTMGLLAGQDFRYFGGLHMSYEF